ncbi:hypothetical protein ABPG77_001631 [Micractinium sp. CCAP 211/92]
MLAANCRCFLLAIVLACAAAAAPAAAAVRDDTLHHSRKLSFDPVTTCKKPADTCSNGILPFLKCCSGQGTTCWQGPVLETTRCVPRPQPPSVTIYRVPGNWTLTLKPKGLPASLTPQLFCSSSSSIFMNAHDPWAVSFSETGSTPGNSSFCLNGPQETSFTLVPGVYKCGTKYDLLTQTTYNYSDPRLTSDRATAPGGPITAPPCLNPAKWLLTIDDTSCQYRYLRSKACGEGNAGMNVSGTIFAPYPSEYLYRLFSIKTAPGHSGAIVGAGTPVNIIAAGRAGACAAVNLASASNTCSAPGLSSNAAAKPSQWVLESAGKPGLVYIRSVARTKANCPARYLGVSKATCNMPFAQFKYGAASLFVKSSPGARTVWRLERA